ncbi:MAG TPA: ATP-binding protein [Thermoanaerobaculia bacterium]|nr:ATP-binding protein [Thermoanaerobaculia bacterium]
MLTSTTAVLLTCLGFTASGLFNWHNRLVADLTTIAHVVSANSTAALTFGDRQAAVEVLNTLREKPSIIAAAIYTVPGEPFARYEPNASIRVPRTLLDDGFHDRSDRTELFYPIQLDHQRLGTLYIASDTRDRNSRIKQYGQIAAVIIFFSLFVAFILAARLQRGISGPIVALAGVAAVVSREKAFSTRISHRRMDDGDEIGDLMTGFNSMLAELEQRDQKLLLHQTHLEAMVDSRTAELTVANEELMLAKNAAEKAAAISTQLARESALILNNATDGILGVGLDNRPTFLNPAGVRILGLTLRDFQKKTIHEAVHHSHADGTPWPEEECVNTVAMRRGDPVPVVNDIFWRPDGTSFPVEYSSTPMFDEDGHQLGAVIVFRDVTERRAIERLKGEFVSTVSHELRTPLTSIRGALGLLSSGLLGPIAEKGQRMLEIAVTNTDRLVRLINDILDLERIESGKVELTRGTVDAQVVLDQAREGLQSIADQAGIQIVTEPATGSLWGDSDRVIQTLTNLIGNAIKFSPAGTTVTIGGTAGAEDFTFRVTDEGRGVPDDKLDSIFQRFSQIDASDSRDKGGSGLGLAICESIVTAHGGRIWAEKNDPVGTRLQFTIPLAVRSTSSLVTIESPAPAVSAVLRKDGAPSVLVIEDDTDLARVMTTALQRHGLRTFHTASGIEAVRLCMQHEPSLIVLDLGLPDLDGYEVVRSLRESEALRSVPLLVYSALDVGSADQSRLRLGTTEFLTKSRCSLADFEAQVVRLVGTVTNEKDSQHAA